MKDFIETNNIDTRKALETVLYVLGRGCNNMYNVLKVIYFADKKRISLVGTTMYKEEYRALPAGAVPCFAYSLFQAVRSGNYTELPIVTDDATSNMFTALRKENSKVLSKIDRRCLDEAIAEYGSLPFKELKQIAHEQEDYKSVPLNNWISHDLMRASLDKEGYIKEYIDSVIG